MRRLTLMILALMSTAAASAEYGCHNGLDFEIVDYEKDYMLAGQTAYMQIGSSTLGTSPIRWTWHSRTTGNTVLQFYEQMSPCPTNTLCYVMGYSTQAFDARSLARSEWLLKAEYLPGHFNGTCRSLYINAQNKPTANFVSVTGTMEKNQTLTFTASGSVDEFAEADFPLYRWEFGNGGTAQGRVVTHAYFVAGTYTARVRTNDGNYWSPWSSKTITITGAPNPPPPEWCGPGTPYQCN